MLQIIIIFDRKQGLKPKKQIRKELRVLYHLETWHITLYFEFHSLTLHNKDMQVEIGCIARQQCFIITLSKVVNIQLVTFWQFCGFIFEKNKKTLS